MTEDREKQEQAKLNAEVRSFIGVAKGLGYGLWASVAMLFLVVGLSAFVATKGYSGDLLIIGGVVALVKLFKVDG